MFVYYLCLTFFMLGIYCLIAKKNIVRKIIGMVIIEYATNLFLVLTGYRYNGIAPIITPDMNVSEFAKKAVDPLPQVLVLTSIVIGLGTLCLMVALAIRLNERYRTFDTTEISRLRG